MTFFYSFENQLKKKNNPAHLQITIKFFIIHKAILMKCIFFFTVSVAVVQSLILSFSSERARGFHLLHADCTFSRKNKAINFDNGFFSLASFYFPLASLSLALSACFFFAPKLNARLLKGFHCTYVVVSMQKKKSYHVLFRGIKSDLLVTSLIPFILHFDRFSGISSVFYSFVFLCYCSVCAFLCIVCMQTSKQIILINLTREEISPRFYTHTTSKSCTIFMSVSYISVIIFYIYKHYFIFTSKWLIEIVSLRWVFFVLQMFEILLKFACHRCKYWFDQMTSFHSNRTAYVYSYYLKHRSNFFERKKRFPLNMINDHLNCE